MDHNIYLSTSSNYYPQGNGLAESSNKNLIRIMRRTIEDNQRAWHKRLKTALWADRITPQRLIGNSPFVLVYGREARVPISLEFPSLELAHQLELVEDNAMSVRMAELLELEEKRNRAMESLEIHQQQVKRSFDKKAKVRVFREGDLVLKWDSNRAKPGKHSKFDPLWSGPYLISECKQNTTFQLSRPNRDILPIPVNGIHLKPCF